MVYRRAPKCWKKFPANAGKMESIDERATVKYSSTLILSNRQA